MWEYSPTDAHTTASISLACLCGDLGSEGLSISHTLRKTSLCMPSRNSRGLLLHASLNQSFQSSSCSLPQPSSLPLPPLQPPFSPHLPLRRTARQQVASDRETAQKQSTCARDGKAGHRRQPFGGHLSPIPHLSGIRHKSVTQSFVGDLQTNNTKINM